MKICLVWDADYPWDVRVEKVASALTGAGHDVHMVARNRKGQPLREKLPEATVHRLAPIPVVGRRINGAVSFPAFFNPLWVRAISQTVRSEGAEVIICRDLPLAPTCIWVGRRMGIPVVLDMAENYPAMIEAIWESGCQKITDWVVRNPKFVGSVERWVLKRIDHVLVVIEESQHRLEGLGLPADRITVVSNTPPLARMQETVCGPYVPAGTSQRPLRLVYLGLMEAPRGIHVMLEGVARAAAAGLQVEMDLIGSGREKETFERQAAELGIAELVRFHGFIPYRDALKIVQSADVGVVPHFANESWNSTIPNKLFDYMAMGMPVLTSDARPAARIVRETGSGEVFRDRDADDVVAALRRLLPESRRREFGEAGRRAIRTEHNWEHHAQRMLTALEEVVGYTGPRKVMAAQAGSRKQRNWG